MVDALDAGEIIADHAAKIGELHSELIIARAQIKHLQHLLTDSARGGNDARTTDSPAAP